MEPSIHAAAQASSQTAAERAAERPREARGSLRPPRPGAAGSGLAGAGLERGEDCGHRRPCVSVQGPAVLDEALQLEARSAGHGQHLPGHDAISDVGGVHVRPRNIPGGDLPQQRAEGEDVDILRVLLVPEDLGRHVVRRPGELHRAGHELRPHAGQPEVADLHLEVGRQQHVVRLDVPVGDAAGMEEGNSATRDLKNVKRLLQGGGRSLSTGSTELQRLVEELIHRAALDELRDDGQGRRLSVYCKKHQYMWVPDLF
mmetsp:Transcript_46205/g.148352  ORF Transcript_46205/g.148352 Transcript_46205/m.148352 type:complete len:258 (-) Transcript_46205:1135-1908(-)